jgi:LPS sulfotransferase NodH
LTRFIILSTGRTGSNLLCWALSEHPNVHSFLEALKVERGQPVNGHRFGETDDPVAYCENVIWNPANAGGKTTIGFKLFWHHGRYNVDHMKIWDYLRTEKTIKKIILVRENVVDQHLSWLRAKRSNIWHTERQKDRDKAKQRYNAKLVVNPRGLKAHLDSVYAGQSWLTNNFRGDDTHVVTYEKFADGFSDEIRSTFGFLGEEPIETSVKFDPLGSSRHAEVIENFDEVKEKLKRTIYFEMLRD